MTRGIHAAAAGMRAQMRRQDVHANNLANAGTVGYRRSDLTIGQSAFARALDESAALPGADTTAIDVTPGPVHETGEPFDLALGDRGLFTLQTPRGLRYSRDGRFQVDAGGRLLSISGHQVMGRDGPIVLPGPEFLVTEAGQVFSEGQFVDRLFIADLGRSDGLRRDADGLLAADLGPRMLDDPQVMQGYVEEANVSVIREMTHMMTGFRAYEASAAALRHADETLGTLIESTSL
ncbi:MAG: flagellar hook-basal body protein [Armatimonadota bacterium]|nr:flagellar hook-basal body protein [Armatimonadota bacterium]